MELYAFTYKINNKQIPEHQDYSEVLGLLNKKGQIIDFVYEYDSKHKLHIHGIVELKKNPFFKTMVPPGVHSRFEVITDIDGWRNYMYKDKIKSIRESQQQDAEYLQTNYIFD